MTAETTPTPSPRATASERMHERGSYDRDSIHAILDAAMLCHVAYVIDGQPYATPTLFWRKGDTLYGSSSASRMLQQAGTPATSPSPISTGWCSPAPASTIRPTTAPPCASAPHGWWRIRMRRSAMRDVVDRFYPGAALLRRPPQAKATTIIAMPIDEAAAKVRAKASATTRRILPCRSGPASSPSRPCSARRKPATGWSMASRGPKPGDLPRGRPAGRTALLAGQRLYEGGTGFSHTRCGKRAIARHRMPRRCLPSAGASG